MAAVDVEWCEFVIWTPPNVQVHSINRAMWWSMSYVRQLE